MINLTVVINNDEAVRKLHELQRVAKTITSSVVKDSERMDASWQKMKSSLMSLTAGVTFGTLAKQVVQVRGEVQQLEVAFETMLGSKEKADRLMSEIVDLAAKTPFGLQDVSNATKMLLAYGSTAEEVTGEIKMLGNIASGLSIPLNDIIYLYGTTRTQGRMFTQDLRQFMGRGIPLAEELAKQFGVTKDKVGELVTAGKVGFDDMARALQAMSSEGGKFNNLMDKQSATISGQISNLEDAIYQMFNEIGKSSEGVISDLISGASWVVEHYQEVLNVLKYVIAAYGLYKTAVILVAAAQKAMAFASSIKMFAQLATYITSAKDAMLRFNMAVKANPIGLLLSILGIIATAIWSFADGTEEATKQMGELEKAARDEHIEVNKLVYQLNQANISEEERQRLLGELKRINPSIVEGISDETDMIAILTSNLKAYNAEQIKKIQLASLTDKQNKAIEDYANADLNLQVYKGKVEDRMAQLVAEYMASGKLPEIEVRRNSPKSREEIERDLRKALDSAAAGEINGVELAKRLYGRVQSPSGVNAGSTVDIVGIDEDYIGGKLARLTKEADDAAKKLETETMEVQAAAEALGLTIDSVTNGVDTVTTDGTGTGTSTKEQTDTQKRAAEAAKLAKELQEAADQAVIDAMEEGTEKKIAQIELDYRKRADAIREQEANLMAKRNGGELSKDEKEAIYALNIANDQAYWDEMNTAIFGDTDAQANAAFDKLNKEQEAWNEYLIAYGTFQEKLKATAIKYNKAIADAETEGERMALEAERDAILAEYEVQASDFAMSLVDMTTAQLNTMLEELQAQVDAKQAAFDALDSSSSDDAKKYRDEINQLKAKIKELQAQLGKAKKEASDGNWAEAAQVVQGIGNAAIEAAEGMEVFDEDFATALRSVANVTSATTNLLSGIQMLVEGSTAATAAIRTMETASVILAVIAAAIQLVSALVSAFSNKEMEETIAKFKELNDEIAQMNRLAKIDSWGDTIFGKDALGNFNNNLRVMREAFDELEGSRKNIQEYRYNKRKEYLEYLLAYNAHTIQDERVLLRELEKLEQSGLKDSTLSDVIGAMQVRLSKRRSSTLEKQLPAIFEDGEVTLEELEELQKSDVWDKLSQENRDLISQMIADWQVYEEATKAVNDYLKDIFGDYGETVTDILVDSFKTGTDAVEEFGDVASDVIYRLTKDFIYSEFIHDFVASAEEDIAALNSQEGLTSEERLKGLIDILRNLENNITGAQDEINAVLEGLDAAGYGFDGEGSGQSATSKGFQAMSQDTGDELNGRFTDIQGKVSGIHEAVQFIKSQNLEQMKHSQSISQTVAMIHNDTQLIEKHTRALGQISEDINTMRLIMANGGY